MSTRRKAANSNTPLISGVAKDYSSTEFFRHECYRNELDFSSGIYLGFLGAGWYRLDASDGIPSEVLTCLIISWVNSGEVRFIDNDNIFVANPGNLYIGLPNSFFCCNAVKSLTEILWCRIYGPGLKDTIKKKQIKSGLYPFEVAPSKTIHNIINELQEFDSNVESSHFSIANQLIDNIGDNIKKYPADRILQKAVVSLYNNVDIPGFGIDDIAQELGIHRVTLNRRFRKLTGMTAMEFIQEQRAKIASEKLQTTFLPISEIALMVGYDNPSNFARAFKKTIGLSPVEYRRKKYGG